MRKDLRQLVGVAGALGGADHGSLCEIQTSGSEIVRPLTSANPALSISWSVSGDVEATVVPRGIAFPAAAQGPVSAGRFAPVASAVNPYSPGILMDRKIWTVMVGLYHQIACRASKAV
jgi:hypothetical protein